MVVLDNVAPYRSYKVARQSPLTLSMKAACEVRVCRSHSTTSPWAPPCCVPNHALHTQHTLERVHYFVVFCWAVHAAKTEIGHCLVHINALQAA